MGEEFKDFEVEAPVLTLEPDLTEEKEKIAKKVEDILNAKEKNSADEMYQQWKSKVTIVMEDPWGKIIFSEKIMDE